MVNWLTVTVFITIFLAVILLGFRAAYWRVRDAGRLVEWGLAGRGLGAVSSWFLLSGCIYSANTFISIPGLVFATGIQGFYTVIYTALCYPILYVVIARFWIIARHRGYVTAADFVHERFGRAAALIVALTSILATMPYLAVQMYGIEVVVAQMGIPVEVSLIIAFLLLSLCTYFSGLRASTVISFFKDIMIGIVVLVGWLVILPQLGGLNHVLAAVHQKALQHPATFSDSLSPSMYGSYATLILGSTLALLLYPHLLTTFCSVNSHKVLKRNAILLFPCTVVIGMVALFGYMAIAAGISPSPMYKTNSILPALFAHFFPAWFAGFAFAALVISALVPAAIMSIGVANLFTRNIYREYLRPACSEKEETNVARVSSFLVKFGALVCILFIPTTFANNLQLMGSVWLLQTLPAVFLGIYTSWFHRWALLLGWGAGMVVGTWMVIGQNFVPFYPLSFGSFSITVYTGLVALVVNLLLTITLTFILRKIIGRAALDMLNTTDFSVRPLAYTATAAHDAMSDKSM
jgi:SSS family solute:Na+ symporter